MKENISQIYKDVKKELFESEETQKSVSEKLKMNNGQFWSTMRAGSIKFKNLLKLCSVLNLEIVIRTKDKKREYIYKGKK